MSRHGEIIAEWERVNLASLSAFITKGTTPTTYGFKWEPSGVLFLRSECVSDHGLDLTQSMFISTAAHNALHRSQVLPSDLLVTITGNVGRVVIFEGADAANLNQHIARVRITVPQAYPRFVYHWLSQESVRRHFISITTGQAYPQISLVQVRNVEIPLPSLSEQHAIAAALDDVDALLTGLDRLIAKKRDIKQAAMQQLLTGQTRLPGFQGEWLVRRLGDVAHIKTGSRNNEDKVPDGEHPFFVRSEQVERINTYSHDCEAILVPGEGRIGSIFHYIQGRFDVHQRVYAITQFRPEVSGRFVHLCMSFKFGAWAMQNTVKATVDSLRLPTFQTFEFSLPPTLEEQSAIATVLSDMDAELAALEARRDKTRALKQGMMQELLTGKTRLVKPEAAHV